MRWGAAVQFMRDTVGGEEKDGATGKGATVRGVVEVTHGCEFVRPHLSIKAWSSWMTERP